FCFLCAICYEVCNNKVDFPIPVSPPINTSEPGTIPPPKTRLNSSIDDFTPATCSDLTSIIFVGLLCLFVAIVLAALEFCFVFTSSTKVFQLLQFVHFPIHFNDSYPLSWQT